MPVRPALATVLAVAVTAAAPALPALGPDDTRMLTQMNREFAAVAAAVTPAVVNISTTKVIRSAEGAPSTPYFDDPLFRQFFGDLFPQVPREIREQSLGSGVIIEKSGIIVTNNHVIERATSVKVGLADGRELAAEIVGADPQTDVAVLRIKGERGLTLPFTPWGDSDALQPGEWVLAVGNPFGLTSTVTRGIVSAVGRSGVVGGMRFENFIQTDASINPGNSGGPLVNVRGEVVGINSAIRSNTGSFAGISFAIPSNLARRVVDSVVKTGRVVRGWLGAEGQNLTPALARQFGLVSPRGVLVTSVMAASPADRAGLQKGDVIVGVGESAVHDGAQLDALIAQGAVGAGLDLKVWRGGAETVVRVTLSEAPEGSAGKFGNVLDGFRVQDITPQVARRLRIDAGLRGVAVTKVVAGSAAEDAGFRPGDVVQGLNRHEVRTVRDYEQIARQVGPEDGVLVYVIRGDGAYFVTLAP